MKKIRNLLLSNNRYLLNLCTTFLSQIISALSILILTPILLTRLGETTFGLYGVILNVVIFAGIFDFGLNIGLLKRLIHHSSESAQLISTLFYFYLFLLIIGIPTCYLLYYLNFIKVNNSILFYAIVTAILIAQNLMAALLDVIIQSSNKIYIGKIIRMSKLIIEFAIILLISSYFSIKIILLTSVFVNLIYLIVLYFFAQKEFSFELSLQKGSFSIFISHFIYSLWYFLAAFAGMLVFNSQVLWINVIVGAEGVAKYVLVTRFFEIIRIGISNFTIILFPRLAKIQAEGNWALIADLFMKSLKRISIFALLIFIIIYFFGMPFFLKWSKYADKEMQYLFTLFAIFIFFIVIDNVSAIYISALKINKFPTIVSIAQGILGLVLGSFLLNRFGIIGMALGSLLALLMTNFLFNPLYLIKKCNDHINAKQPIL